MRAQKRPRVLCTRGRRYFRLRRAKVIYCFSIAYFGSAGGTGGTGGAGVTGMVGSVGFGVIGVGSVGGVAGGAGGVGTSGGVVGGVVGAGGVSGGVGAGSLGVTGEAGGVGGAGSAARDAGELRNINPAVNAVAPQRAIFLRSVMFSFPRWLFCLAAYSATAGHVGVTSMRWAKTECN